MAAVKRLDLTQQLFNGNEDVQHKPPFAAKPSYTIQKFHNRSSLFPSTVNKQLYQDVEDKIISERQQKRPSSSKVNAPKPPTSGRKPVRNIRSATARLERTSITAESKVGSRNLNSESRNDDPLTCYNKNSVSGTERVPPYEPDIRSLSSEDKSSDTNSFVKNYSDLALVPVGGKPVPVVDVGWDAPYPEYHYLSNAKEKYKSSEIRPFITPSVDVSMLSRPLDNSNANTGTNNSEESNLKPSVYGLSWQRQVYGSESDLTKVDDTSGPYKLSSENDAVQKQIPSQKCWEKSSRKLPESLQPLGPWLTENVSELLIGVDPKKCLVFLPSLVDVDYEDIPEVPLPHDVNEDLPYKEKLVPVELPPPKKYEHPSFNKKPVEEWVCKHSKTSTRIMSGDGLILHERFAGPRTVGIVRKEIYDLEKLLQGIGTLNSDCMLVRYQAEIDNFRKMYEDTMAKIPDRYKYPPEPPEDMFGLRQFYKEHDEVIREIKREHAICLQELALLEVDAGIESDRKYFKQYAKLPDQQE